ncbi:MAG: ATP-dependent DNA ligase, partial [Thermoplasmata archaeon]
MRFAELAEVYRQLEATSKRLEIRSVLVTMVKDAAANELPEVLYLSQGMLRPEYEGVELGIADSLARRAVAEATGHPEADLARAVQRSGDLGTTAETLLAEAPGHAGRSPVLTVHHVYEEFSRIARATGGGSQEEKVRILADLIGKATPAEGKYLARFALGKLRLGVREMSLLDALTVAFTDGSKASRARIEGAYNVCSDLGMVALALLREGLTGLDEIRLEVGRPLRPMLAERSKNLNDVLHRLPPPVALEYKYDGLRVQAHVPAHGPPRLFSRRLEDITDQFPELSKELPTAFPHRPVIVEGECVPIDPQTEEIRPFQEVSRRRGRKYDLERMQEEVPVCLFLFDLLLDPEGPETEKDFPVRRERLTRTLRPTERVRLAKQVRVDDVAAAERFFEESIAEGCEGVMAKSIGPGSTYRAGARGYWWIKYKRDYTQGLVDSIDGVVVGAFFGRGRRAGRYGALLMAVYNDTDDRFESFCKVGTGFDDATLGSLPERLKPFERKDKHPQVVTGLEADQWFDPSLVLEIQGAELSLSPNHPAATGVIRPDAGLALRFPRFTGRFRDDKSPRDATTTRELVKLYRSQVKQVGHDS